MFLLGKAYHSTDLKPKLRTIESIGTIVEVNIVQSKPGRVNAVE